MKRVLLILVLLVGSCEPNRSGYASCGAKTTPPTVIVAARVISPIGVPVAQLSPVWYAYSNFRQPDAYNQRHTDYHESSDRDKTPRTAVAQFCLRCHAGSDPRHGLNLDHPESLDSQTRLKAVRMVLQEKMPPGGKLAAADVGRLLEELVGANDVAGDKETEE